MIMGNKIFQGIFAAIFACNICMAQNPEPFSYNPDITPSVETFQIRKYGNIVPAVYTGAMSFTLPLYAYHDEDFDIPITLMYHFDGYRPATHSGTVGYGWALNCGGSITREVRGYPDETAIGEGNLYGYYWAIQDNILSNNDFVIKSGRMRVDYIFHDRFEDAIMMDIYSDMPMYCDRHQTRDDRYETSPDIFHFDFLGITGDFMLRDDGTMEVFNSSIPEGEISIEYNFIKYDTYAAPEFTINTGDGYKYVFGGTFNSIEYNAFAADNAEITPSGFKLRRIIAPNGNEAVFAYGHHLKETRQILSYFTKIDAVSEGSYHYGSVQNNKTVISVFSPPITQISINGKKLIAFSYVENGHDENTTASFDDASSNVNNIYQFYYQKPMDLRKVEVFNWTGSKVTQITLEKQFAGTGPSRMFLTGLDSTTDGKFGFSYHKTTMNPPRNNTKATDYWGYWNGQGYTGTIVSHLSNSNYNKGLYNQFVTSFTANEPSLMYSMFGGMKKIVYPTGGYSEITYEQNTVRERIEKTGNGTSFESLSENMPVGGVRVKRIDNVSDEMSDFVEYSYVSSMNNTRSSGVLMYMPRYGMRTDYRYKLDDGGTAHVRALGFTDQCDHSPRYDPVVVYPEVRETFANGSFNEFFFAFHEDVYPYSEQNYTVLAKNLGINQIYPPSDDDPSYLKSIRNLVMPPMADYSRTRGRLKMKNEYDASGKLMRTESITYDDYQACSRKSYFNTLLDFVEMDCKWYSSRISSRSTKLYYENDKSFSTNTAYSYNSSGQLSSKCIYSYQSPVEETINYRYCKETVPLCPQWLKGAVSDISKTIDTGNGKYIASVVKIQYNEGTANPNPAAVTTYSSSEPYPLQGMTDVFTVPSGFSQRTDTFTYDGKFRLTMVQRPGSAYIKYVWDTAKRHIVRKESNSPQNSWGYEWKDLVGPTKIAYPTTGFNLYGYDRNGRLSEQRDLNGDIMYEYQYHLENE